MRIILLFGVMVHSFFLHAQEPLKIKHSPMGIFSTGLISFAEMPDIKEAAQWYAGVGGQAQLQLSRSFSSEWSFGLARGKVNNWVSKTDLHLKGTIVFYPTKKLTRVQPYLLVGPIVLYSQMNDLVNTQSHLGRWAPGVVIGIATHFNITPRFDISLE